MINECDKGSIASVVQHFMQTDLQRTELPAFGFAIDRKKRTMRVHDRPEYGLVLAHNHHDEVAVRLEQINRGAQERVRGWRPLSHRRPGKQGLVSTHPCGEASGQNDSANARG